MIPFQCDCGAAYSFRDDAAGRAVRCRRCGAVAEIPPLAASAHAAPAAPPTPAAAIPISAFVSDPLEADPDAGPDAPTLLDPSRHAWSLSPLARLADDPLPLPRDILEALFFFRSRWNLMMWLTLAASLTIVTALAYQLVLFRFIQILMIGLPLAFYMEIVRDSAAGARTLPDSNNWESVWESALQPIFQFLATLAIPLLPAMTALALLLHEGHADPLASPPFQILAAAAFLLWPVTLLAVALGGLSALLRADLLLLTILRTLPSYLLLLAAIALVNAIPLLITDIPAPAPLAQVIAQARALPHPFAPIPDWLLRSAPVFLATTWASIATMRLVGLHYLHCRRRFPWTAG